MIVIFIAALQCPFYPLAVHSTNHHYFYEHPKADDWQHFYQDSSEQRTRWCRKLGMNPAPFHDLGAYNAMMAFPTTANHWVDLKNTDQVKCTDAASCDGLLYNRAGSTVSTSALTSTTWNLGGGSSQSCVYRTTSGVIEKAGHCTNSYRGLCHQFCGMLINSWRFASLLKNNAFLKV